MRRDDEQPKVLLVGSGLTGGGAETRLRLLAHNLFKRRCDVAVIKNPGAGLTAPQETFDLKWDGKLSYPAVGRRLRAIMKSGNYDAALGMGLYQNALLLAACVGLKNRPALVFTETTRPFTNAEQDSSDWARRMRTMIYKTVYPRADLMAANSIDGVDEIVSHYGVSANCIRRIPNIVGDAELAALSQQTSAVLAPHVHSTFVMVSRLVPMKRVDTLLEAVAGLGKDINWAVDILGDGPQRTDLEDLVRALGLEDRVRFVGWVKNPTPYIARSLATVSCSTYEGFSNTVLESMALGTPVLTSLCSSDALEMGERDAALTFHVGDAVQLRSHLKTLLSDSAARSSLVHSARDYIQPHRLENAVPAYETLVRDAIALKRASSNGNSPISP